MTTNPSQGPADIGAVPIDPKAEQNAPPAGATAQQEAAFYRRSGQQWLAHNQQNLGLLGRVFGSSSAAPTNIAGTVVLCCLTLVGLTWFVKVEGDVGQLRTILIGLIGSALSFIFGAASKK